MSTPDFARPRSARLRRGPRAGAGPGPPPAARAGPRLWSARLLV